MAGAMCSMIFQGCVGPDVFSWIRHYGVELKMNSNMKKEKKSSGLLLNDHAHYPHRDSQWVLYREVLRFFNFCYSGK